MPCVPGIRSNRTLECLEIFLRLLSSEALGKSALAFPGSSMSPGGIVFPRESEAEGVDLLYASTPPQTDTVVPRLALIVGEARPHSFLLLCFPD